MSDDLQPSRHAGEADALPGELTRIYRQLERDGMAWSSHVPDTAGLKDFVTTLAAGDLPQSMLDTTKIGKEFTSMRLTDDFIETPMDDRPAQNPVPTPKRPRSFIAPVAAVLLVILLAAVFVWRTQQHATTPGVRATTPTASTTYRLPPNAAVLTTTLLAGDDIWGAGATFTNPADFSAAATGFIMRYSGGQWHMVDNTDFPGVVLESITMLSDAEGWATGRDAAGQSTSQPYQMQDVVYHYMNGHWSKADIAIPANRNVEIQPTGPDKAWMLTSDGSAATFFHYSGGTWKTIVTPATFDFFTMLSDSEGWFNQQQALWHYQAGQWHNTYSVASGGPNKSVTVSSFTTPSDGWGLLYADPNYNRQEGLPVLAVKTTVIHWNGSQWTPIPAPSQLMPRPEFYIDQMMMHTAHDGWANVIEVPNGNETIDQNTAPRYLVHYLNGIWSLVSTPAKITFTEIKMTSSTEGWATGQRYAANGIYNEEGLPVILHYQDGAWNVVG